MDIEKSRHYSFTSLLKDSQILLCEQLGPLMTYFLSHYEQLANFSFTRNQHLFLLLFTLQKIFFKTLNSVDKLFIQDDIFFFFFLMAKVFLKKLPYWKDAILTFNKLHLQIINLQQLETTRLWTYRSTTQFLLDWSEKRSERDKCMLIFLGEHRP